MRPGSEIQRQLVAKIDRDIAQQQIEEAPHRRPFDERPCRADQPRVPQQLTQRVQNSLRHRQEGLPVLGLGRRSRHQSSAECSGEEDIALVKVQGSLIGRPSHAKTLQCPWGMVRQFRQHGTQVVTELGAQPLDRHIQLDGGSIGGPIGQRTMHECPVLPPSAQQRTVPGEQKDHGAT